MTRFRRVGERPIGCGRPVRGRSAPMRYYIVQLSRRKCGAGWRSTPLKVAKRRAERPARPALQGINGWNQSVLDVRHRLRRNLKRLAIVAAFESADLRSSITRHTVAAALIDLMLTEPICATSRRSSPTAWTPR